MRGREMSFSTRRLTILGLMVGILLLLPYTPLGYLNIGPLAITFNMIPVAICAITLGPIGGLIAGSVFGITSFCQCFGGLGIGVSPMGAILFGINPFLAFIQRFVPRALVGFLLGYIFRWSKKIKGISFATSVTGFFAAFLNTVFFMIALLALYGNTEYVRGLIGGQNIIVFACAFVGVNAVVEMIASTIVTGAVGTALFKTRIISTSNK